MRQVEVGQELLTRQTVLFWRGDKPLFSHRGLLKWAEIGCWTVEDALFERLKLRNERVTWLRKLCRSLLGPGRVVKSQWGPAVGWIASLQGLGDPGIECVPPKSRYGQPETLKR